MTKNLCASNQLNIKEMIIDDFYRWLLTLEFPAYCRVNIKKVNFENNALDHDGLKRTLVIDFDNDIIIGKFVVWDDNSCFTELIDGHSTESVIHERFDFKTIKELQMSFQSILTIFNDNL